MNNPLPPKAIRAAVSRIAVCAVIVFSTCVMLTECGAQSFSNAPPSEPVTGFELPDRTASTANDALSDQFVSDDADDGERAAQSAGVAAVGGAASASKRLFDVLRSGGVLMIPIALCSFILVVFIFERMISLRKARIIPGPFSTRFLDQLANGDLDRSSASALCEKNNSPIAHVFAAGVQKWGRPSVEVEQAVLDEGERTSTRLRSYLRLINGVATVCPLLGMLGTVLGMIHAFDAIATLDATMGDPKAVIATGISQALLTTAAGMTVAIPALIAYLFFSSRADKHVMEIDRLGMMVVNLVSAEALTMKRTQKTSSKTTKATKKAA
jgi:biopolymer transport protein ExbB